MSAKPKILFLGDPSANDEQSFQQLRQHYEVVAVDDAVRAAAMLSPDIAGIFTGGQYMNEGPRLGRLLQSERILESMPNGVALLSSDNTILWANDCLKQRVAGTDLPQPVRNASGI